MRPTRVSAYLLFAGVITAGSAAMMVPSGGFEIIWSSVDGGGGTFESDDGTWNLGITFAQSDTRILEGGVYSIQGGFWPGPEPTLSNVLIDVDIKPGVCPNGLNCFGRSIVTAAILGAEDLDVEAIDILSLAISRADGIGGVVAPSDWQPGPSIVLADVGTPFSGEMAGCHDFGGDGYVDLTIPFRTEELAEILQLENVPFGADIALNVTGRFLDGTPFSSLDWLHVLQPCRSPGVLDIGATVRGNDAPDAWLDVSPRDNVLDAGGFGPFERCYPLGSVVTISAMPSLGGADLIGWEIDGQFIRSRPDMLNPYEFDVTVTRNFQEITAVYGSRPSSMGTGR